MLEEEEGEGAIIAIMRKRQEKALKEMGIMNNKEFKKIMKECADKFASPKTFAEAAMSAKEDKEAGVREKVDFLTQRKAPIDNGHGGTCVTKI